MKYKIWNVQYKCNIVKTGQRSLLQSEWPHMTPQVILKCKENRPYVHHAASGLDCATQRRGGFIVPEESDLAKLLHVWVVRVCPICECVRVWSHRPRTRRRRWRWRRRALGSLVLWEPAGPTERPHSSPLELVDVEGEFEGGAELQAHVLHHHVASQQQEGLAVNLVFSEEICVRSQHRVDISDVLHDFLHRPQVGVLAARLWALTETAWKSRDINEPMNEWIKKKKNINKHLLDIKPAKKPRRKQCDHFIYCPKEALA